MGTVGNIFHYIVHRAKRNGTNILYENFKLIHGDIVDKQQDDINYFDFDRKIYIQQKDLNVRCKWTILYEVF